MHHQNISPARKVKECTCCVQWKHRVYRGNSDKLRISFLCVKVVSSRPHPTDVQGLDTTRVIHTSRGWATTRWQDIRLNLANISERKSDISKNSVFGMWSITPRSNYVSRIFVYSVENSTRVSRSTQTEMLKRPIKFQVLFFDIPSENLTNASWSFLFYKTGYEQLKHCYIRKMFLSYFKLFRNIKMKENIGKLHIILGIR